MFSDSYMSDILPQDSISKIDMMMNFSQQNNDSDYTNRDSISKIDMMMSFSQHNNDSDYMNREELNSSINANSNENFKVEENIITNKKNIFKTEKLTSIFTSITPIIPKLDKNDNDIFKETEAETFNKEKKSKDNNINYMSKSKQYSRELKIKSKPTTKKRNRKKYIFTRKYNSDNIRRKIISKFFRCLIKNINKKLRLIGIKKKFNLLPAAFRYKFISKVLKEKEKYKIDFTFGQLVSKKNILGIQVKEKSYKNNINTLKLLKNSILNNIINLKFSQLYEEYLKSEEFNDGKMDTNEKSQNYIYRCKKKAIEFLCFFKN